MSRAQLPKGPRSRLTPEKRLALLRGAAVARVRAEERGELPPAEVEQLEPEVVEGWPLGKRLVFAVLVLVAMGAAAMGVLVG